MRLLDCCKIGNQSVCEYEGTKKYIATGDIINNRIVTYEEYYYDNKPSRANLQIEEGNVIFAKMKDTIKVLIGDKDNRNNIYSTGFCSLVPNDNILSKYLFYYLNSESFNIQKNKYSSGATQQAINNEKLKKIMIKELPTIEIQRKIINKLDAIMSLIEYKKSQIDKLNELIKSQFVEMFGKINNYEKLSFYIDSLTAGKSLAGESECKNKVLKTGSVSYDYFNSKEVKNLPLEYIPSKKHAVKKDDVIISRMNTIELVGACGYVWENVENLYYPDRLWKANLKRNCNAIYIWQSIIQKDFKLKIRKICSGTSGSMKNISKTNFLNLRIKKAPIDLQNKFADIVKQIDKQKFEFEKSLKKLEELKNSLMQEYFG